jgi:hypothetical protein
MAAVVAMHNLKKIAVFNYFLYLSSVKEYFLLHALGNLKNSSIFVFYFYKFI